jgi:hypothetical protein
MQKSPKKQKKRRKSKLSVIERSTQYRVEPSKRTKQVIAAEIQCCGEEHAIKRKTKRRTSTKSQNHPYAKTVNEPSKRTSHTFALRSITPKLRFTAASHHGHCKERAKGKEKPLVHPAPVPLEKSPI